MFSYWRRNQSNTFFTGGESIATVKSSHLAVESLLFLTRHPYLIHLPQLWVSLFKWDIVLLHWFYVAWLAQQNHHLLFLSRLKKKLRFHFMSEILLWPKPWSVTAISNDQCRGRVAVMKIFRCKTSPCTNENYAIYFASNLMLSGKEKVNFFGPISSRLPFTLKTLYTLTSVCIFSILFSKIFPGKVTRRICLTIKSCFSLWSFPLFSRL